MTAVEWLIEQLTPSISLQQKHIDNYKAIAKEMEKQQIKEITMAKQTSIEWLWLNLTDDLIGDLPNEKIYEIQKLVEQANEMHKEQIIDAYKFALSDEYVIGSYKYYTSTYGSNHIVDTNEMIDHIGDANKMVEISDEEIKQYAKQNAFNYYEFISGAKWYREQLNKKEL